jgi:hypothetical protein
LTRLTHHLRQPNKQIQRHPIEERTILGYQQFNGNANPRSYVSLDELIEAAAERAEEATGDPKVICRETPD